MVLRKCFGKNLLGQTLHQTEFTLHWLLLSSSIHLCTACHSRIVGGNVMVNGITVRAGGFADEEDEEYDD